MTNDVDDLVERLQEWPHGNPKTMIISETINEINRLQEHNAKLVAALEAMLVDPPSTLDEPDMDYEVIQKMREIAREALGDINTPCK